MTVVVANGKVEITGDYERDANPFGLAIGMLSSNRKVRQRTCYLR